MTQELTAQSATRLAELIRARAVSPVEVVKAHLRRAADINPRLNAIVTFAPDALDCARAAETAVMRSEKCGLLHGVPVTIKDTIDTAGLRTTSGAVRHAGCIPAGDAPAVALLRRAGAIILGKTNVSEMAMALDADNPLFGRTNNPFDETRTPGGSSGGEAAAISAGLSPAGLGSDLCGSIRVPAHFCGVVGLKPTIGCIPGGGHTPPVAGALALGASIGPLARHVEDLALLYFVLTAGEAAAGAMTASSVGSGWEWRRRDLRGERVAWYTDDGNVPVTAETEHAVHAAVGALGAAGLVIAQERPPGIEDGPALWFSLFAPAAAAFLRATYAGHEDEAGPVVQDMLLAAGKEAGPPAADDGYAAAVARREVLRSALLEWMQATPLIVAPVGAAPAFAHGARRIAVGGKNIGTFRAFGYAQTYNVFGLPAVCVPAGESREGLPIGVQIVGRPGAEKSVLSAAAIVEQARGGWRPPPAPDSQDERNPL